MEWWQIVLIIVGVIAAILMVSLIIYCCRKRKSSTRSSKEGLRKTTDSTRISTVVLQTGKEDWDPRVSFNENSKLYL